MHEPASGPANPERTGESVGTTPGSLAARLSGQHVPDILDTLANLSSDEVFTPPRIAQRMLAEIPSDLWSNPNTRILDMGCKSGIFLREAALLLDAGLASEVPDPEARREHIFKNMLFGLPITMLTGDIARRTLYYAKDAASSASVVRFDNAHGNLPYARTEHVFKKSKTACDICGAPIGLERGFDKENHAYPFIHPVTDDRIKEILNMEFDLIIGNPPYQLNVGEEVPNAVPLYHLFVKQAISMSPRFVSMIIPSRWFSGGRGLDAFRNEMLSSGQISHLVDYPDASECFPGVEVKGGVSYFLWDKNHRQETCHVTTVIDGESVSAVDRVLNEHSDVFIRRSESLPILSKVRSQGEGTLTDNGWVSEQTPFGLHSNFKDFAEAGSTKAIQIHAKGRETRYVSRDVIKKNRDWIDKHLVLTPKAAEGDGRVPNLVLGQPIITTPPACCTQTFLVAGRFASHKEAVNFEAYLKTRFVRFLVSLVKTTQSVSRNSFRFVPALDMKMRWTDDILYKRYGLAPEEIAFIESIVKEMP